MAGNSKEVDLVIRAKDLSQKVLKENEAAIDEVTSALADQAKQAQKTDASLEELESGLKGLSKVEAEVAKQQTALDKALGSTAITMDRAVGRQQAFTQAIDRSKGSLAEARANAAAAAEAYSEYANSIGKGETATKQQQRTLEALAKAVDKADAAVQKAGQDVVGYTIAQRNATSQVAQLVAIQQRMADSQKAVAAAMSQVTSAVASQRAQVQAAAAAQRVADEQTKEAKKAAKKAEEDEERARRKNKDSLDAFTRGQRESLSWYQRLRGEVIALAASYAGLQGALGLAKDSLDAFQQRQQTSNVLGVAIGSSDPKEIAVEFDYVRGVADRLGFRFKDLAKQYSAFSVAARQAGASSQETRFIFEQVSKATRVLGLSTDDARGVFLALQQMFSKGKISAEELRQQLGERLPGAVAILSKALNLGPGELDKMLEKGAIGADKVLLLAKGLGDTFGRNLGPATKGLAAEMGRFQTAMDDFKESIANMGFADAFTKFLRDMTAFFKSSDGQVFAQRLSSAFSSVLTVLQFVIQNFDTLKDILLLIVGIKVAQMFLSMFRSWASNAAKAVQWIVAMNTALTASGAAGATAAGGIDAAAAATTRLATALGFVQRILLAVTAAFVGWEIGAILNKKFEVVRVASILLVNDVIETWIELKNGVVIIAAEATASVVEWFDKGIRKIGSLKNGFLGGLADAARGLGLDKVGDFIAQGITAGVKTGLEGSVDLAKQAAAQARALRDKELAAARAVTAEQLKTARLKGGVRTTPAGTPIVPGETAMPGKSTVPVAPPDNSKDVAKRERLEESLADKLNALNQKVEKNYKDSLESRLEATRRTFKDIEDTIAKAQKAGVKEVSGMPLADVKAQVAALKEQALQQETLKFNTEALAKAEKDINDLLAERKNRIAEVTSDHEAGLITIEEAYKRIKKVNDDLVPAINLAADGAKKFADGLRGTPGMNDNKLDAFTAKMERIGNIRTIGQGSATATDGLALFNQGLQQTNTLLQQRNAEVATYNQLVELGAITQTEANDKIKAAFEATQPQIEKSVQSLRAMLQAMQAAGTIAPEKLAALNAQLLLIETNAKAVDKEAVKIKNAFEGSFTQGFQDTVNAFGDSVAGLITRTKSWGEAWKDVGKTALSALGNIAQSIANAITQIIAMRIATSLIGGAFGGGGAVPVSHSGTVVGSVSNRSRAVDMSVFAGAPRYHKGTVVGLRSDEQAAILQRGEEVLSKDNPRNIMNRAAETAAGRGTDGLAIRNVLVTDPNMIPDALQSAQGEKTLVTVLGKNRAKVRKILGF